MPEYNFPQDLCDAQLRLHQVDASYAELCRTLPWSVDPAPGWAGDKQPYTDYRSEKPDSPGYTEQQKAEEARLRGELLELSTLVSTHEYWAALERGDVVEARMALKHIHDEDGTSGDAGGGDRTAALAA